MRKTGDGAGSSSRRASRSKTAKRHASVTRHTVVAGSAKGNARRTSTTATKRHASTAALAKRRAKKWSAGVMAHSDAMDLESGVFKSRSAKQVALSLKRSAEASHRRKSTPFRSAMSMLNFEINRGGKNLSAERLRVLNRAKVELRKVFHREPA